MASASLSIAVTVFTIFILASLESSTKAGAAADEICYNSIISFGDSLADTGNLIRLSSSNSPPDHFFLPPYGENFFHHPTGRCSDGRLIIDFVAESFGLPLTPAYFSGRDFGEGVNFAVAGATAIDDSFFQERGVHNPFTNASLGIQLGWFKDMLHSFCRNVSDCKEFLQSSLVLMGEIGGNDYNHAFFQGKKLEEVRSYVPAVVQTISSAIKELIELGAETLIIPGNLPIGCSAAYLTYFQSSNQDDYDMATGCIKWLNKFSNYHNKILKAEINRIRGLHPHATIIYADYYNAAMRLYRFPNKYGFTEGALTACCGGGGPYNYNESVPCGYPPSTSCDNASLYVSWDGLHLTEAAYRLIAQGLLQGPYSSPPVNKICNPALASSGLALQY